MAISTASYRSARAHGRSASNSGNNEPVSEGCGTCLNGWR